MKIFWGVAVPAFIFIISFALTFMLYRKFSKGADRD